MKERHFLRTGFNLLPYRAAQARMRKWRYGSELISAAAVGFALAGAIGYGTSREMVRAAQQKKALEQQLAALQPVLKERQQVEARGRALATLQLQRSALAELLAAAARAATPDIRLIELNYQAGKGTLNGVASSPAALSRWLRALKHMPHFSSIELTHIRRRLGSGATPTQRISDSSQAKRALSTTAIPSPDTADLSFLAQLEWAHSAQKNANDAITATRHPRQQDQP